METKLSEEQRQEPEIGFRAVGEADADFLFKVYVCTREQEMNLVPWSEEQKEAFLRSQFLAQQQHYTAFFAGAEHSVITINGEDSGRLHIDRGETELYILDITI